MSLPSAVSLQSLPDNQLEHILSLLFEPSPVLSRLVIPEIHSTPIASYSQLSSLVNQSLSSLPTSSPDLLSILSAHPRLGAKKVDSAQSQKEQSSLGSDAERQQLQALNEEYEARYPGLRYVVFVNGRSREEVMKDMRYRIENGSFDGECKAAIQAMCDIALDRARKLGIKE
jgi:2-oxo-4-hydroxy-4-carboxy--5-ureidoimidazoline (OHCU) decarboxylase